MIEIIILIIVSFYILFNIIYTYITKFKKIITINKKKIDYTDTNFNTIQTLCITDEKNKVYILKNNIWLLHFENLELYNNLEIGTSYEIEGTGVVNNALGFFPNIHKIVKLN